VLVSSCWERIVLKEGPYQFGRVESSCGILRAHHDMLRPGVSHPTDKIMHDRHMITTAHPFFPNDIGLMKEDGWIAGAMIAFSPLSQPEWNGRISFGKGTSIGNNGIACSMQFKEGNGAYGIASTRYRGICARDGCKCTDSPGKFTGKHIRHTAAI